jgi:hypothetical protein
MESMSFYNHICLILAYVFCKNVRRLVSSLQKLLQVVGNVQAHCTACLYESVTSFKLYNDNCSIFALTL